MRQQVKTMGKIKKIKEISSEYLAMESIKRFRLRDVLLFVVLALFWLGVAVLLKTYALRYSLTLLTISTFMAASVFVVRKTGTATSFMVLSGLLTLPFDDIGISGVKRLMVLVLAGLVFEFIFLFLKIEFKNLPLDITLGTTFSAASIPLTTALILSPLTFLDRFIPVLNLSILAGFLGLFGAVLAFIWWYQIKTTKWFLRFEYG